MKIGFLTRESLEQRGRRIMGRRYQQDQVGDQFGGGMTGLNTLKLPLDEIRNFGAAMADADEAYRVGRNRVIAWGIGLAATAAIAGGAAYMEHESITDALPEGTVVDFGMSQPSMTPEEMPAQLAPTDIALPLGQSTGVM